MKTTLHRILTIVFVAALTLPLLNAQNSKPTWRFGATPADSLECLKNQSLYNGYYTQDNYDMAITFWRQNFNACPISSENIYIRGAKMYESFYQKTGDKAFIDTVIMILDKRIEYYGDKATNDFRKAYALSDYSQRHPELLPESYKIIDHYVKNDPSKLTSDAMVVHMNNNVTLYRTKRLQQEDVINNYSLLMELVDKHIAARPNDKAISDAKSLIDDLFRRSGVATCDNLIPLFTNQVASRPNDTELLRKVAGLLENAKCTDSELYYTSVEKLYKMDKTSSAAYQLAEMSFSKDDFDSAEKYYLEAVSLESDPLSKSNYLSKLATLELVNKKNYIKARDYAKMVVELNPNSGTAHFIIGSAYAASPIAGDDFEKRTNYWVAADYFNKAKALDPSLAEKANESISACAANFPKQDDAFFVGILIEDGAPYTVKGWINERTTVRFRK
jgi:tetratricopeptide (TPR) repeat protein